jgi:polyisoprenyl-teichoic acid--peptidoglycan teichoic acid transferase
VSFLPKTRGGTLWRALLAAVLVIGLTAGVVATAGLLQVKNLVQTFAHNAAPVKGLTLPAFGKPETILLIGSDHRGDFTDYAQSNTDTMLLVRIDDSSSTINLMSVPRDLDVIGPAGTPVKLNSIYSTEDGPAGLLKVLKQQVFPKIQVTHVVDTSFIGFSNLIDAIGCVYTDVDRRYYNVSGPGADNFSSINIQPGYQKLCGGAHSETGTNSALAFVRYRETDSDEVRNARQQDFIRWAKDGYSTGQLVANRNKLVRIFAKYTHTDSSLASEDGLIDLFDLVLDANGHSLKTIQFPEYFGSCSPSGQTPCYVYPCPDLSTCTGYGGANPTLGEPTEATEAAWKEFITPTKTPAASSTAAAKTKRTRHVKGKVNLAGLTADPGDGASQAGQLGNVGLPVLYPKYIVAGEDSGYCFSLTGNCLPGSLEPASAYVGSYPRRYEIFNDGTAYKSYVMTLVINQTLGEFYTVQGTTWKNPPILNHPSKVVHVNGHELFEYEDGGKISLVATKTSQASYWISNTLDHAISNTAMIGMGSELTRYSRRTH